jgi:hypothetical protein
MHHSIYNPYIGENMITEFKSAKFYRDRLNSHIKQLVDSQNETEINKMLTYVYEQIEKPTDGHVIVFLTDDCGFPKFKYDKNIINCLRDKLRDNGFKVEYIDYDIFGISF